MFTLQQNSALFDKQAQHLHLPGCISWQAILHIGFQTSWNSLHCWTVAETWALLCWC